MLRFFSLLLFLTFTLTSQAQSTQTVRGQIVDKDSKYPVIGATVVIVNTNPILATTTDLDGYFKIENVPLGRISIKISSIGYEPLSASNLLVVSGKELQINFQMEEQVNQLDEIVITSKSKREVNNDNASVSIRSFDSEQASKYAGDRKSVV